MDIERIAAKKRNLQRRAEILRLIRQFFQEGYYLEVETPQLAPTPLPEAFIEPIATERGWLLPSPELYMNPLLAADFGNIFQICHTFRKGEKGIHNQEEFTLLEYYRIGHNYMQLAAKTEELVTFIAASLNNSTTISYQGQSIDLSPPWLRLSVSEAFTVACGWDPVVISDPERFDFELATTVAELSQTRPLVLYDFPAEMASLSRLKAADDKVAERAEIFIGGLELANIFSELTDPIE
ncbi:MAG: EF-P lysine aminoacylase GenX, partial [Dehalococcoidia bacterium]